MVLFYSFMVFLKFDIQTKLDILDRISNNLYIPVYHRHQVKSKLVGSQGKFSDNYSFPKKEVLIDHSVSSRDVTQKTCLFYQY